jgi:hypothetical protein
VEGKGVRMKILGETTHRGYEHAYIVDISNDELQEIMGYKYVDSKCPSVKIGDEINVSAIFHKLIRFNENGEELKKIAKQLKDFAALLEPLDPIINEKIQEATAYSLTKFLKL